jgi:cell filamentation protein
MSSKVLTPEERQALEYAYGTRRLVELLIDPVQGHFDAAHLREINRRIFQDLPGLGLHDITPGQYRPPVAAHYDWLKTRTFETINIRSHVAYSRMDDIALARLDDNLKEADPIALAKLDTPAFTKAIGTLYTQLDYIHPFSDGNSRTLRAFTRQLAEASGYNIDWDQFGQSPVGRDLLYIARDLSVNELALPHIVHDVTKRDVLLTIDQLEGNRDLPSLLQDAVSPICAAHVHIQAEGAITQGHRSPAFVEPSLEEQLREQERLTPLSPAQLDEPGMDY